MMSRRDRIHELEEFLDGLHGDARYWELRRTYGDYSRAVLRHLEACARAQRAGRNHT